MRRKKLLSKSLDEIESDLDMEVINAHDCMATALEEFEGRIIQACRVGHTLVRDAQLKIKGLFDYLSRPESSLKLSERDNTYFREMYSKILDKYNLFLDEHGIVKGARVGRFIKDASSGYSKSVVEDPFRSFRT